MGNNNPSEYKWIDLVNPDQQKLDKLVEEHSLPAFLVVDCLEPDHLPKYEKHENLDFLILRVFDQDSDEEAKSLRELTRKIAIFAKDNVVITIHRVPLPFLEKAKEKKYRNAGHLLASLIKHSLLTYEKPLENSLELMENIESILGTPASDAEVVHQCFYLRRRSSIFKRMVHMSADVITRMSKDINLPKSVIQDLKEVADDLFYYADDLQENIDNLLTIHLSILSDQLNRESFKTNEVMRLLTVLSMFFMPLNFIVGIYGMNFSQMPFLQSEFGFWGTMIFMALMSFTIYMGFKKKGWLKSSKFSKFAKH